MNFSTDNYALKTKTDFPFTLHTDQESRVSSLKITKNGLITTNTNKINIILPKKTKKIRFVAPTTKIEATDDLIIAGDERGTIKLFDYKKTIIQQFDEHIERINGIKFLSKNSFISCSNDMSVKTFDFNRRESMVSFNKHSDYATCVEGKGDLVYSGSLDKSFVQYDLRTGKMVNKISFDEQVDNICLIDSDLMVVGSKFKLHMLDLRNMAAVKTIYAHTKEISNIKLYENKIYTSSLDGILKTYNTVFKKISQMKFDSPILDFDIHNNRIFVGLDNGQIYKYEKQDKFEQKDGTKTKKHARRNIKDDRYFHDEEFKNVVQIKRDIKQQKPIERLINSNQHWHALSLLFQESDMDVIYSVLAFLKLQRGFLPVLRDRKATEIINVVDLILNNLHINELRPLFLEIFTILTSLYENEFVNNIELRQKLEFLHEMMVEECEWQEEAVKLQAFIEAFVLDN